MLVTPLGKVALCAASAAISGKGVGSCAAARSDTVRATATDSASFFMLLRRAWLDARQPTTTIHQKRQLEYRRLPPASACAPVGHSARSSCGSSWHRTRQRAAMERLGCFEVIGWDAGI